MNVIRKILKKTREITRRVSNPVLATVGYLLRSKRDEVNVYFIGKPDWEFNIRRSLIRSVFNPHFITTVEGLKRTDHGIVFPLSIKASLATSRTTLDP